MAPQRIPDDWSLDTKISPWVMLHYMNSDDTKLMVAITQRLGFPYYDMSLSPTAKPVDMNGNRGYFQEWDDVGEVNKNGEINLWWFTFLVTRRNLYGNE
ncbi:hypothetical protein [Bacillus sp. JJ722]|uniref:hypothetical protein n=1 Tax=Bacillus sp. JJ722 TaxID=3122973 RepID=UPI002FFF6FAA